MSAGVTARAQAPDGFTTAVPVGVHIAGGAAAIVVGALVASVLPSIDGAWRVTAVALAVGLFAATTRDLLASAAVVALAWLVVNGFLVDRLGQLSWHGSADLDRVAVLAGAAGAGLVVSTLVVRSRRLAGCDRSLSEEKKCRT